MGCNKKKVIRCLFYIIFQITGGIIGSAIIRGIIPFEVMKRTNLGMCTYGGDISSGGALGMEFMFSMLNLYIAFGTALDRRQTPIIGGAVGAFFISITLGFSIIASSGISPNYIFGFNMARCLCPAIVTGIFNKIWPYMVGPIIACITIGTYIHVVPPFQAFECSNYNLERVSIKRKIRNK